jgi:hypothetical protein
MCSAGRREVLPLYRAFAANASGFVWRPCASGLLWPSVHLYGGRVLLSQVLSWASRSNSALVTDACAAALRASYSAAQRER